VIAASAILVVLALITLIVGVFSTGLGMIYVSIASSALAALTLFVGVQRDKRKTALAGEGAGMVVPAREIFPETGVGAPALPEEFPADEAPTEVAEAPLLSGLSPVPEALPETFEPEPVSAAPRARTTTRKPAARATRTASSTRASASKPATKSTAAKAKSTSGRAPAKPAAKAASKKATPSKTASKTTTAKKVPAKAATAGAASKPAVRKTSTKRSPASKPAASKTSARSKKMPS
jgi:hypothetical protein